MRLFFGLSLPEEVRAVTCRCAMEAQRVIPGRYALCENHHITLAFLGDVPEERLEDAKRVLEGCVSFPAPRLTLCGFSHFGRAENGILILDEATSALDSVTEAKIQKAFDALAKGRTTLIIAHRLSTIRQAGRIISIADGLITESGTHEELMQKGGMYSQLYTTQTNIARNM
mgnify:CR=1 FL=1